MRVEDIYKTWEKDSDFDLGNLSSESTRIPKLHNKYYRIYMEEGMKLKKMKIDLKSLTKLKTEYYRGMLDDEELKELGWEPFQIKLLKQDAPLYVETDKDVQEMTLKVGLQDMKVDYLESIIRMINNRGFQIKSIIDFEKFRTGAN